MKFAEISLYMQGNVIVFNGSDNNSNYNPFVGQEINPVKIAYKIYEFIGRKPKQKVFLRALNNQDSLSTRDIQESLKSNLECIAKRLEYAKIKVKLIV